MKNSAKYIKVVPYQEILHLHDLFERLARAAKSPGKLFYQ